MQAMHIMLFIIYLIFSVASDLLLKILSKVTSEKLCGMYLYLIFHNK